MPPKNAPPRSQNNADIDEAPVQGSAIDRVGRVLAYIAVKGDSRENQVLTLRGLGFSNTEIGLMFGIKPVTVRSIAAKAAKKLQS